MQLFKRSTQAPPTPILPLLPLELQLHILRLAAPPPSQHRERCHTLSRLSLVCQAWRLTAQYLLLSRVRYVLAWRRYGICVGRHFRALERRADQYKSKKLEERLKWLGREKGVKVKEMEVSLLLFMMPFRLGEGDEMVALLKEVAGEEVEGLTVRYDPEGGAVLPNFLALFPNLKRLRLQSETMSDPAQLPSFFFTTACSSTSCPVPTRSHPLIAPAPPLPPYLSSLTHLTLHRLTFDRFPPTPLPSLLCLTFENGGLSSSSLPVQAIDCLFTWTPNLVVFSWQGFRPYPTAATFANAPASVRDVHLNPEGYRDLAALSSAIRGFHGHLRRVEIALTPQCDTDGATGTKKEKHLRKIRNWCKDRGTQFVVSARDEADGEAGEVEDGFDEELDEDQVKLVF